MMRFRRASECLLENSFLVQSLPQLVEHLVAVLQYGEADLSLVDTIVAPRSPILFLSLGVQAC